jgi:hypothetical protein
VLGLLLSEKTSAEPPLTQLQVHVFHGEPNEVKFEPKDNVLHAFCNARRGHLIYVYQDKLAVVEKGCTKWN